MNTVTVPLLTTIIQFKTGKLKLREDELITDRRKLEMGETPREES